MEIGLRNPLAIFLNPRCKVRARSPTNPRMKKLLLSWFALVLASSLLAQTKTLLNLDQEGVALQGHDPVAFITDNKPVKGKPEHVASHKGARYYFATRENRVLFKQNPAKYEPAFGGYCAYGVSRNKLVEIDVNAFQVVQGRLLMQYSKGVREDFNKNPDGNLAKADQNWAALLVKKGK